MPAPQSPQPTSQKSPHPTRDQRRELARQQAREARERQQRAARRTRLVVVALVVVAVLGLVAALVSAVLRAQEGRVVAADVLYPTQSPALADVTLPATADPQTGGLPVSAAGVGSVGDGVTVDVYLDPMCPWCGVLEQVNGDDLAELVAQQGVTVVYHPVAVLDELSRGTVYSTRAVNALGVVADRAPAAFPAFLASLFAEGTQPQEGSEGLDDDTLASLAESAGVPADVTATFTTSTPKGRLFAGWAAATPALIPLNAQGKAVTPTVLIDGERWEGDFTVPGALRAAIETAIG
ncbi:MAG: DsbA family protein [Cellulomonas sp.]|uniref:DsbA family protein n=1 Tax=Cellulomonas sp. TaxID=40001 RepID=UPI00258FE2DC|nr:DsbA family protein [Cellulomonas sp.]MCR6704689.1 DsbA family protein [Cellulomonas sp.]